jgi:hypothetical protein
MRRRDFITLVGGVAAGWPFAAHTQQQTGKLPRIGSIQTASNENTEALSQGLREAGYVDGQNIILDTRYHYGSLERIDEFARELIALGLEVTQYCLGVGDSLRFKLLRHRALAHACLSSTKQLIQDDARIRPCPSRHRGREYNFASLATPSWCR